MGSQKKQLERKKRVKAQLLKKRDWARKEDKKDKEARKIEYQARQKQKPIVNTNMLKENKKVLTDMLAEFKEPNAQ